MFDVKIDGIKEVQNKLNKIAQTAKEFGEGKNVPLSELMTNGFVKKHTEHDTFESFATESGLISEGEEVTEEILNSNDFNEYVKDNTDFDSWEDMLQAASVEYIQKQLGF